MLWDYLMQLWQNFSVTANTFKDKKEKRKMTGRELIKWIQENKAEDLDFLAVYDAWDGGYIDVNPKIQDLDDFDYKGICVVV